MEDSQRSREFPFAFHVLEGGLVIQTKWKPQLLESFWDNPATCSEPLPFHHQSHSRFVTVQESKQNMIKNVAAGQELVGYKT